MENLTEIIKKFIGQRLNVSIVEDKYVLSKYNSDNDVLNREFLNDLDNAIKNKDYSFPDKYKIKKTNTKIEDVILKALLTEIKTKEDLEIAFHVILRNFHIETLIFTPYIKKFELKKDYFNILLSNNHEKSYGFDMNTFISMLKYSSIVNNKNNIDVLDFKKAVRLFLEKNYEKVKKQYRNYYKSNHNFKLEHEIYEWVKDFFDENEIKNLNFFKEIEIKKLEKKELFKESDEKYFILDINNVALSDRLNFKTTTQLDEFFNYFKGLINYSDNLKKSIEIIELNSSDEKRTLLFNKINIKNKDLIYEFINKLIYLEDKFDIIKNNYEINILLKEKYRHELDVYMQKFEEYFDIKKDMQNKSQEKSKIKI